MIIAIDTEFNGFGGELISLALVSETGEEFYEVLSIKEKYDPWVEENVVPYLEKDAISYDEFQKKLQKYLFGFGELSLTIVADWPDDIRYFCESLIVAPGEMIKSPEQLNLVMNRNLNSLESEVPHNALYDARAIMKQIKGESK